jgi:hypothetical protein
MDELYIKRTTPETSVPEKSPRKPYAADGRDRLLLPLTWAIGFLGAALLGSRSFPGLGITLLTLAWYAVLIWYRGREGLPDRTNRLLLAAVFLLSLTFSLYSNRWLWGWNLVFLLILTAVQMFQLPGQGSYPWTSPLMLAERFCLLLGGLFGHLPAAWDTVRSYKGDRRILTVLAGLLLSFPFFTLALLLLTDGDLFFAQVVEDLTVTMVLLLGSSVLRLLVGLGLVPFLFGLLYTIRHPKKREMKEVTAPRADALLPCVVLGVMDLLYATFIAVQFTVLFGGPAYLERISGLSYAEYARSGFFQLVFVAVLNLTLTLSALQIAKREGGTWKFLRILAAVLIVMSAVILASAAYRMSLYVSVYGLSFKRFLTCWGMAMLTLFFVIAFLKVWKKDFCCFKYLFAAAISGWLILNFCNVDRLVAKYNMSIYQQDQVAVIDLEYLVCDLSYDTLVELEALPENTVVRQDLVLAEMLRERRQHAAVAASDWRTWSVSAAWAAKR